MITIPFSLPTTYVLITPAILKNLIGHLMGLVVKVTSRRHYTARNVQVLCRFATLQSSIRH